MLWDPAGLSGRGLWERDEDPDDVLSRYLPAFSHRGQREEIFRDGVHSFTSSLSVNQSHSNPMIFHLRGPFHKQYQIRAARAHITAPKPTSNPQRHFLVSKSRNVVGPHLELYIPQLEGTSQTSKVASFLRLLSVLCTPRNTSGMKGPVRILHFHLLSSYLVGGGKGDEDRRKPLEAVEMHPVSAQGGRVETLPQ